MIACCFGHLLKEVKKKESNQNQKVHKTPQVCNRTADDDQPNLHGCPSLAAFLPGSFLFCLIFSLLPFGGLG